MKKKIFALVLVVALVASVAVGLAACDNDASASLLFGKELVALTSQLDALTQLNLGGADIAVIDSVMAGYYLATGDYADTMAVIEGIDLSEEDYGIAVGKGKEAFMGKINEAMIALYNNGTMTQIAEKYGLENEIKITADTTNPYANATDDSWDNIVASGSVSLGYTEFAPIAYVENGTLTGYDIELAYAVFDYLNGVYGCNISVEPFKIERDQKITLIENGTIDVIWNGMTITDELQSALTISIPYLANKQSCVVMKSDLDKYDTIAEFLKNSKDAIVAVENGSAAYKIITMEI